MTGIIDDCDTCWEMIVVPLIEDWILMWRIDYLAEHKAAEWVDLGGEG
jgi:hypothetical protein